MATAYTKADAIGIYLSGADSNGATQLSPAASLGGYRSGVQVKRLGFVVRGQGLRPVRIDSVGGNNPTGDGFLYGNAGTSLTWAPYGINPTTAAAVTNGSTVLIESATAGAHLRVTRLSSDALKGVLGVRVVDVFNDLLGFDNVSSADATAGKANYRAGFIRNHSDQTVTGIKLWLKTLGTQRATGTAQLGASGAGTITTATANGFADWPAHGWARIKDSGGTLREIVYYVSRTATSLTVPADGRARLGTSAGAGSATDTVDAIPGIRIGLEAPSSNAIQIIANETTAPSGITWNTATTSANGLSIASLASIADYGLWIHRDTPPGLYAAASLRNSINIEHIYNAVTYDTVWSGLYRVANNALRLYELYEGVDADATFTTPDATSATLPFTFATTPPGSGTRQYRGVVRYRNAYNLTSLNTFQRVIEIDSSGNEVTVAPTAPSNISLFDAGGGKVRIRAYYQAQQDDPQATQYAVYLSGDGTDPDGSETPLLYDMAVERSLFWSNTIAPLNATIGPFALGQDLRALVRSLHAPSGKESTNTTAATLTVGTTTVGAALYRSLNFGSGFEQKLATAGISGTDIIHAGHNIYWSWDAGYLELWMDTDLAFRIRLDSSPADNNGLWTTFGYVQETLTGTPADEPVEVIDANTIYITANGIRRMKIDKSAETITFASMNRGVLTPASSTSDDPVFDATFRSLFQVYDPYAGDYATALDLDYDGTLRMNVPWRQRGTVGAFE